MSHPNFPPPPHHFPPFPPQAPPVANQTPVIPLPSTVYDFSDPDVCDKIVDINRRREDLLHSASLEFYHEHFQFGFLNRIRYERERVVSFGLKEPVEDYKPAGQGGGAPPSQPPLNYLSPPSPSSQPSSQPNRGAPEGEVIDTAQLKQVDLEIMFLEEERERILRELDGGYEARNGYEDSSRKRLRLGNGEIFLCCCANPINTL